MANWKLKLFGALFAVTVLFGGTAQAQIFESFATATFTASARADIELPGVDVMKIEFTPGVDGAYLKTLPKTKGWLWKMVTNPGSTAPTDDYDIYIRDSNGVDILGGSGVNRDTVNSEQAFPLTGSGQWDPVYWENPAYLSISGNAQAGATGETFLYIFREKP